VLPQAIVDTKLANLEKSPANCAVFTVTFHARDGAANDEKRRRFALVVPHVRRALVISKVDLHKVEAAPLADALVSGMFIVDEPAASFTPMQVAMPMVPEGQGSMRARRPT
jgi:hypothetical protein